MGKLEDDVDLRGYTMEHIVPINNANRFTLNATLGSLLAMNISLHVCTFYCFWEIKIHLSV